MTTFIEDSPRSFQAGWITRAHEAGTASGAVMTPWATPYVHRGGPGLKPGIGPRVQELRDAGVSVWFDATTHALQMPGVGDFRYYAEYNLWGGPVGDLTQDAYRREHVRRVFKHQSELGTPLVAPAPLLPSGLNNVSTLALETARVALELEPTAGLTIAGVGTFWSDSRDLDAHVGALAALMPSGWFISFVQPDNDLPPKLTAEEVYGICRTVRALSEYVPVHVSHGDFAASPRSRPVRPQWVPVGTSASGWCLTRTMRPAPRRQAKRAGTSVRASSDCSGHWTEKQTGRYSSNRTAHWPRGWAVSHPYRMRKVRSSIMWPSLTQQSDASRLWGTHTDSDTTNSTACIPKHPPTGPQSKLRQVCATAPTFG